MKFLFKEKYLPVMILSQCVIFTVAVVMFLHVQAKRDAKIHEAILCDFFVQISEWQSGHQEFISPDFSSQNEQGALRTYNRVIREELGLCEEGLCLDSARISLFKSCPDDTTVEILKDTIIYY